jgi:hypothetical protein
MAEVKDFGFALKNLKGGQKVARQGWNGKGMFVVLRPGYPGGAPVDKATADALNVRIGTMRIFEPWLMFHTMDGNLVPWVASQTDLLSTDWMII